MSSETNTPSSSRAPSSIRYEYFIAEMHAARSRIDEEIRTINQFEIFSIIAVGLIYWFILSAEEISYIPLIFASSFPVLISLYGIFRYRAHAGIVKVNEAYIKFHIERTIYGKASLRGLNRYYDRKKSGLLKTARYVFWFVILAVSFAVFVIAIVCPEKLISAKGDLVKVAVEAKP